MNVKIVIAASAAAPEITAGPGNVFAAGADLSESISGNEVAVDECTIDLLADYHVNTGFFIPAGSDSFTTVDGNLFCVASSNQVLPLIPAGTALKYFDGTVLIGKFYLDKTLRIGAQNYRLAGVSALGLLENVDHPGGVYTGESVVDVLQSIISTRFTYSVDAAVSDWPVYGWLPYATARSNLHWLILAMGLNILKDASGDPYFTLLSTDTQITIPDSAVDVNGSASYDAPATKIQVIEHSFGALPTDELVTLFDNTDGAAEAENATVIFDGGPYHDLQTAGSLIILQSNANYAILSGVGVLTGRKYSHMQRAISLVAEGQNTKAREIGVSDVCLVNALNSYNVATRLFRYYTTAKKISGSLWPTSEKPGNYVSIRDAFGDLNNAFIGAMRLTSSAVLKSTFEAVVDYVPGNSGNFFEHVAVITFDGTWRAEKSGRIRIVLIGGGQGGQGGFDGTAGAGGDVGYGGDFTYSSTDELKRVYYQSGRDYGGAGGAAGKGGIPGHVLVLDVDIPQGEIITLFLGRGGAGSAANSGADGTLGTETQASSATIGSRSSASGTLMSDGYAELIGGMVYGAPGIDGIPGGAGGATTTTNKQAWNDAPGEPGENADTHTGGAGGAGELVIGPNPVYPNNILRGAGGGGGGAAYGANGTDGGAAAYEVVGATYRVTGGAGGNGADAAPPVIPAFGGGGNGGHGGGGGGNAGGGSAESPDGLGLAQLNVWHGDTGAGGAGSDGSDGGDGIVLIYY